MILHSGIPRWSDPEMVRTRLLKDVDVLFDTKDHEGRGGLFEHVKETFDHTIPCVSCIGRTSKFNLMSYPEGKAPSVRSM